MPSSHWKQINEITELIYLAGPVSILDIGPGNGKYGFLAREYLDAGGADPGGKYSTGHRIRIDAIEAFPDYIGPMQRLIYNSIYEGNARDIVPGLPTRYDLVLLIDVLEHFTREEGNQLLDSLINKADLVLISTPKKMQEQGAVFGNEFETHRFEWKAGHYHRFPEKFIVPNPESLIVLIGKRANEIRQRFSGRGGSGGGLKARLKRFNLKVWISGNFPGLWRFLKRLAGRGRGNEGESGR